MILFIDNYDSFTYNLVQFCGSVNHDIKVVRNDEITVDEIKKLAPSHIILSPGPGYPKDAGICEEVIKELAGQFPILGICLGLQLLFASSEETPGVEGLGICSGKILRIPDTEGLKIPHMGWNSLSYHREPGENPHGRLFAGIPEDSYVYFVHSYYLKADDPVIVTATTEYGTHIHASIEQGNVFGCQFHPEKSSSTGLAILKNFLSIRKEEF